MNAKPLRKDEFHYMSGTKLYGVWLNLKNRCFNEKSLNYKDYMGRGITVCYEWAMNVNNFLEWANSSGYKEGLTLDRINNDGNYEPSNCRWVTRTIQSRNQRLLKSHNKSGYRGVSFSQQCQKFRADIRTNGKTKYLGLFTEAIDAAKAYDSFVIENNLEHTRNFV